MSTPASPTFPSSGLKTILIIDDDVHLAATLILGLESNGYHALSAPDATAGWKVAHAHLPDLILCDIDMPDKDGRRLLKEMRNDPVLADRQIVLMTGKQNFGNPRAAMDLGADDFLLKPISLKDLLGCVDARLKRAQVSRRVDAGMVEQLRESLHSTLPHEFFTPLASVMGLTELLQSQLDILSKDEIRQDLKDIRRACRRLHRSIRNYLLILELDDPELERPRSTLGSDEVAKALASGIKAAADRHQRPSDLDSEIVGTELKADALDLAILAEELVDNAMSFSRRDTRVRVRSWVEDGRLHFAVADEGRGMTPEQLARLGVFSRDDSKWSREQGLGFGLPLVRMLVRHLGGEFHLDSESGKGTRSQFTLPVAKAA